MPLKVDSEQQRHRPGVFKQPNKAHKTGRHRSKGSLETAKKGKVQKTGVKKIHQEISGLARKNRAVQLRKNKRDEFLKQIRTQNDPPFVIALVSVSNNISYFDTLDKLKNSDPEANITYTENGYTVIRIPRFKQRFMFVPGDMNRVYHTLNAVKTADTVLFLASVEGLDENSDHILACIAAQGIPSSVVSIVDLESLPKKKHQDVKDNIFKSISSVLPTTKTISLESLSEIMSFFRVISSKKPEKVIQRDKRPYILAESVQYVKENEDNGSLKISGFLRGQTLSVNDLVHITGWRDFKLNKIEILKDPHKFSNRELTGSNVLHTELPDATKQETLESEVIPDPMDAEQTWPTEEELKEAEENIAKKIAKQVPEGFSDYQSAWIPDCDGEELSDISDLEEEEDSQDEEMELSEHEDDGRTHVTFGGESIISENPIDPDKYDQSINKEEETSMLAKLKEAKSEKIFPDEVDTPLDTLAKVRFQKYRGLKSMRTSPWDPKENLPLDYARIFQFQNFKRTEKKIRKELQVKDGFAPGTYLSIYLAGVTETEFESIDRGLPLIVTGVLPHEQKMSVVNVMLKRPNILESDEPIKSKEELVFQCGYRIFKCRPIFSQLGNGTVHKYERFFQPDETVMATFYAPIQYPPCAVLAFKEHQDLSLELVATGRLTSVDADRIVVKRTILTGHPFKVNRKSAVIRFMFYNREDIEWFKKIELHTKYGRRGHIKEPLGTHGHMKCIFDKQIKSQDTVLMNLYKRVFPKWTYRSLNTALYHYN